MECELPETTETILVERSEDLPKAEKAPPRKRRPISKAFRAGIILPPSRVKAKLRASGVSEDAPPHRFEKDVDIWIAGAVEGVLRRALEAVGRAAQNNRTRRGLPYKRPRVTEENLEELGKSSEFAFLVAALKTGSTPTTESTSDPIATEQSSFSSTIETPVDSRVARCKWQYEDNGWRDYDALASDEVERCYQTYLSYPGQFDVRSVRSGSWAYQVDFPQMLQTNIQHEHHTRRNIRRVVA